METHDNTSDFFATPRPAASTHGLAALLRGWWLRVDAPDADRSRVTLGGPSLLALCGTLTRAAYSPMWVTQGHTYAGLDTLAQRLRRGWPPRRLVLVDGLVELGDLHAIDRAIAAGQSPFDVELRTLIDLVVGEETITMTSADPEAIDMVAAALLRAHVARCLHVPPDVVREPDLDVVIRLRANSDLLLRPIETEVMAGSVDVGIARTGTAPAPSSIIYDRTTGQWHMG